LIPKAEKLLGFLIKGFSLISGLEIEGCGFWAGSLVHTLSNQIASTLIKLFLT